MTAIVIGADHRRVPLDVLERLSISASDLPKVVGGASRRDHVAEAVVLSTCNRTEVYAVVDRFHDAYTGLCEAITSACADDFPEAVEYLDFKVDDAAARHLFSVASGLDSVVVGETDIVGQIRRAWETAREEEAAGPHLNALFRQALEVGKRARTETGISRSITSVSAAAVALIGDRLGDLSARSVLVVGAGTMGSRAATALAGAGAGRLSVASRTYERAAETAARIGADTVSLDDLVPALVDVDVLVTASSSPDLLLERDKVGAVAAARRGRPLLIVDIAVPRDVDRRAGEIDGVTLLGMDDIKRFVDAGIVFRHGEIEAVERIVDDEVDRYRAMRSARSVAPVVTAMRERAEAVRSAELKRAERKLAGLTDSEMKAVEAVTRRIVAKLLHGPNVRLGELAGTVRGDRMVEVMLDLFESDEVESLAGPDDPR